MTAWTNRKQLDGPVTREASRFVCEVMESVFAPEDQALPPPTSTTSVDMADRLVLALFRAEGARLVSLARFFTDDRAAAEDLVQEAFIRLARSAHRISDEDRAAAYLRSIVINLARDHNRRGLVSFRHRPPAVADEPSAEDQAARRESQREVVEALRALPRRQRDCLALRYYLELPIDQIAATLDISANSVKTHLKRGLRSMAASLDSTREEQ